MLALHARRREFDSYSLHDKSLHDSNGRWFKPGWMLHRIYNSVAERSIAELLSSLYVWCLLFLFNSSMELNCFTMLYSSFIFTFSPFLVRSLMQQIKSNKLVTSSLKSMWYSTHHYYYYLDSIKLHGSANTMMTIMKKGA